LGRNPFSGEVEEDYNEIVIHVKFKENDATYSRKP
jgi:hypothetical protein